MKHQRTQAQALGGQALSGLSGHEAKVIFALEGSLSLVEIAERSGLSLADTRLAMEQLRSKGLVGASRSGHGSRDGLPVA